MCDFCVCFKLSLRFIFTKLFKFSKKWPNDNLKRVACIFALILISPCRNLIAVPFLANALGHNLISVLGLTNPLGCRLMSALVLNSHLKCHTMQCYTMPLILLCLVTPFCPPECFCLAIVIVRSSVMYLCSGVSIPCRAYQTLCTGLFVTAWICKNLEQSCKN